MSRVQMAAVETGHRLRRVVLAAFVAEHNLNCRLGVSLPGAAVKACRRLDRDRVFARFAKSDLVQTLLAVVLVDSTRRYPARRLSLAVSLFIHRLVLRPTHVREPVLLRRAKLVPDCQNPVNRPKSAPLSGFFGDRANGDGTPKESCVRYGDGWIVGS